MDVLERTLASNREASRIENDATHALLKQVIDLVGQPEKGPANPATGVYWAMARVSERVAPFERRFEQTKGAMKALSIGAVPAGLLIWFLAGDKLTKLLHG